MCLSCIKKLVKEVLDLNSAILATGGPRVVQLHVVQHSGHIHTRLVHADAQRSEWDACGGSVEQLHAVLHPKYAIDIEEYQSMEEADDWGLTTEVIRGLSRLQVAAKYESLADDTCSICREELDAHSGSTFSLPCGHVFHESCVKPWFMRHHTCPNCRADITLEAIDAAVTTQAHSTVQVHRHTGAQAERGRSASERFRRAVRLVIIVNRLRSNSDAHTDLQMIWTDVPSYLYPDSEINGAALERIFSRGKASLGQITARQYERIDTDRIGRKENGSWFKSLQRFWGVKGTVAGSNSSPSC